MTLVIEIEFLTGNSVAALQPDSEAPDWPPQPDRVFSALVATWAYRGERPEERAALEWLESLDPPRIQAPTAWLRTSYLAYVPPNDRAALKVRRASDNIADYRSRQPRRFITVRPASPTVRLVWADVLDGADVAERVKLLDAIARDTAYVGHSSSLTRCRAYVTDEPAPPDAIPPLRRVYRGRMDELVRAFASGRRPSVGEWVMPEPPSVAQDGLNSAFSTAWLVFEHVGGVMPDVRACALVAQAIRTRIIEGYLAAGTSPPPVVTGRSEDGVPESHPHLAIVPLPFAGFPHADGRVLGFACVPPRGVDLFRDEGWLRALRAVCPMDVRRGRRVLRMALPTGDLEFSPTLQPAKRSLDPALYTAKPSHSYATVTPVVLNRQIKARPSEAVIEMMEDVASACEHIGLPRPQEVMWPGVDGPLPAVQVSRHSAWEGAPSVISSRRDPAWVRWQVPDYLKGRMLTHAVIRFSEPVVGPVMLGAGRYLGLGLCRPLPDGGEAE